MIITGKISTFGGPEDTGVLPSEGVAIWQPKQVGSPLATGLFLKVTPIGTTGLARRLDPDAFYIAMRWDYKKTPVAILQSSWVLCRANGLFAWARPADWGPNARTGRVADLSPGLARYLNLQTDDIATFELWGIPK